MDHYIGLDAHSKTCTFVALNSAGEIVREGKFDTSERSLKAMTKCVPGKVALVFEETNIAHWIYMTLKDEVAKIVVCHPAHLPRKSGPKNDYRDALHLAKQLKSDNFTSVHHDCDTLINLRSVITGYETLVFNIVQQKNRLKALLRSEGLPYTATKVARKRKEQLKAIDNPTKKIVAERTLDQIETLETVKRKYIADFHANRFHIPEVKRLRTIPGIGPVRAHVIAAYVATGHRFQNKHKLWAYSKLVRHHDSSDGVILKMRTPQGRTELKNAFMGAALKIIVSPQQNGLKNYYNHLVSHSRLDPKKARKALARKVAAISLVTLKKSVKYNDALVMKSIRI